LIYINNAFKNKSTKKSTSNEKTVKEDKCVLLRDVTTSMLLIVPHSNVSTSKTSKIGLGNEVSYVSNNRVHGRGTVILIGEFVLSLVFKNDFFNLFDVIRD